MRFRNKHHHAALNARNPRQHGSTQRCAYPFLDNVERLSLYQNERYAVRYVDLIEKVRAKETKRPAGSKLRLTPVIARNLAKLTTYKDEYEVARLYANPVYLDKLRAQFEGEPGRDYELAFHLAPPLLAKRDEHGHLKKLRFGQWTLTRRVDETCTNVKGVWKYMYRAIDQDSLTVNKSGDARR